MKRFLPIILLVFLLALFAFFGWFGPRTGPVSSEGRMRIHFIDVGQGDCILVQTPDGRNMLVDSGNADRAEDVIKYLRASGVGRIDLLVITHPHADHMGGMPRILDKFGVSLVVDTGNGHSGKTYRSIMEIIESRKIDYRPAKDAPKIDLGKQVTCEIIWPPTDDRVPIRNLGMNDRSIVLRLEYGEVSVLLMGGIQLEAEGRLLSMRQDLKSTILKVADYGSRRSTSNEFLQVVRPSYVVLSVGKDNPHGHPARATMQRLNALGAQIFRTDELGTVVFSIDGRKVQVHTAK